MSDQDDKTEIYLPNKPAPDPFGLPGGGNQSPPSRLVCTDMSEVEDDTTSNLVIPLVGSEVTVGRGTNNTFRIKSNQLSREHARIFPKDGRWMIEDLDSRNGTWVNDARVEQAFISPSDSIRIGPIPFRLEIDRPEVQNEGPVRDFTDTVVDKTMLVGSDIRAASSLLKAAHKRETTDEDTDTSPTGGRTAPAATRSPEPQPAPGRAAAQAAAPAAARGSNRKFIYAAVGVIVLAIVGYFGYDRAVNGERRQLVEQYTREIKNFVRDYEQAGSTRRSGGERISQAVGEDMLGRVTAAADSYPASPELAALQAQARFLVFERELAPLLENGDARAAYALLDQVRSEINGLRDRAPVTTATAETFEALGGMLNLAEAAVQIRAFRLKYPNPERDASQKPGDQELADVLAAQDRFAVEMRKRNLVLSVGYMYFLSIVQDIDENDLRIVNRWREIL